MNKKVLFIVMIFPAILHGMKQQPTAGKSWSLAESLNKTLYRTTQSISDNYWNGHANNVIEELNRCNGFERSISERDQAINRQRVEHAIVELVGTGDYDRLTVLLGKCKQHNLDVNFAQLKSAMETFSRCENNLEQEKTLFLKAHEERLSKIKTGIEYIAYLRSTMQGAFAQQGIPGQPILNNNQQQILYQPVPQNLLQGQASAPVAISHQQTIPQQQVAYTYPPGHPAQYQYYQAAPINLTGSPQAAAQYQQAYSGNSVAAQQQHQGSPVYPVNYSQAVLAPQQQYQQPAQAQYYQPPVNNNQKTTPYRNLYLPDNDTEELFVQYMQANGSPQQIPSHIPMQGSPQVQPAKQRMQNNLTSPTQTDANVYELSATHSTGSLHSTGSVDSLSRSQSELGVPLLNDSAEHLLNSSQSKKTGSGKN